MKYDRKFWDRYADENESRYDEEFAIFVRDLATSLGCSSVLEVGCGTGIDLRRFAKTTMVYGIDLNDKALAIARTKFKGGHFRKGDISALPFGDSSVDFVFTHGLLNYLDDVILERGVSEMYRVAKRYIMNCELFAKSEKRIDENAKFRNMRRWWHGYNVKISDINKGTNTEQGKAKLILLHKL